MTKAREIIVDALEDLVVQADEAPIEASEAQAAIRFLNDRMFAWDAMGISLGYTEVSNLGDEITVPAGAIMGIKAQLAIDLAAKYSVDVKPDVYERARQGMNAIMNVAGLDSISMEYPYTLPMGSGNDSEIYTDKYYSDQEATILTETGGSIALEEDTEE